MSPAKKGMSIGASLRGRMDAGQTEEAPAVTPPAPRAQPEPDEALESFNTRIPRSLFRRLKLYAAREDIKIQEAVGAALEAYLKERE